VPPDATGQDFTATADGTAPDSYAATGTVTDENGTPLAGVTIIASDDSTATTASDGTYSLSGLVTGTYTLTPTLPGHTFTPASLTVSVPPDATGQDFTATADGTAPDTEPSLEVNYQNGQPGSLFIFTGQNLPISASINVTINGVALPFDPPLVTDNTGTVGFMLSTSGLAPGVYKVTITAGDEQVSLAQVISTNTSILLDEAASLRTDEDRSAPMLPVPTTVQPTQPEAEGQRVYLPLVIR
jgi:hypothetical protein